MSPVTVRPVRDTAVLDASDPATFRILVTRPAVVTEVAGTIVGAYRADFVTSRYAYWTGLTVLPEHRRQHIASGLTLEAAYVTRDDLGRGQITTTHHALRRATEILEGPVRRREKGPDIRPAP